MPAGRANRKDTFPAPPFAVAPMKRFFAGLVLASLLCPLLSAQTRLGEVSVETNQAIKVHVTSPTPELLNLAVQAFNSHGKYQAVAAGAAYEVKFTLVAPTQVRVEASRGTASVVNETVSGRDARQALLKAADLVVERTNGTGLKGFFTAQLAFIQDLGKGKEVCTGDLFFGGVVRQTQDNSAALFPRWAPDGNRLIYTSFFRSGFPDIYVIDLASRRRDLLIHFKGTNQGARFSPSGNQIAMVLSGEGNPEIYVGNGQGTGVERRTAVSGAVKSSPAFSPDGSQIIYASEPGPQLYVMANAKGAAPRRVSPAGFSQYCAEPDWSRADPNKVVFTARIGGAYRIAVLNLATGQAKLVEMQNAPFDAKEPSWLADGRHVIYTAVARGGDTRLAILDTETGKSTPVSPTSLGSVKQASVFYGR
jgi:TolB protein